METSPLAMKQPLATRRRGTKERRGTAPATKDIMGPPPRILPLDPSLVVAKMLPMSILRPQSLQSSSGSILGGGPMISFIAGAVPRLSLVPLLLVARGGFMARGEVSITYWLPPVSRTAITTTGRDRGSGVNFAESKES